MIKIKGSFHKNLIAALKRPYIEKETGIVSLEAILRKIFNKDNE